MLALFLLLVIVAIALGIVGAVVKGLFWLLIIGIVVVIVDLILLGMRARTSSGMCLAASPRISRLRITASWTSSLARKSSRLAVPTNLVTFWQQRIISLR